MKIDLDFPPKIFFGLPSGSGRAKTELEFSSSTKTELFLPNFKAQHRIKISEIQNNNSLPLSMDDDGNNEKDVDEVSSSASRKISSSPSRKISSSLSSPCAPLPSTSAHKKLYRPL